jgi:uncharacterized protein (DUF1800 family)
MRKSLLVVFLLTACAGRRTGVTALAPMPVRDIAFPPPDSANVVHLLDRVAFGPRPGDIAHIQAVGIGAWLEEQLNPARVSDSAERAALAPHEVALRNPTDLFEAYEPGPAGRADSATRKQMQEGARNLAQHVMMSALARHIASERQLLEVMTDFWTNHFNVFMGKDADRFLTADFVEQAIRPNALGRFEDLLVATAEHPAMLVYLDNAQSVAPGSHPPAPGRAIALAPVRGGFPMFPRPATPFGTPPPPAAARAPTGINENYARELMELHTLGVDGGYTQQDVINVARILTGWGVSRPRPMGPGHFGFEYHDWAHDRGEKEVLDVRFLAGQGMKEGLRLLHLLAEHPSTARHISHKLCARFVADTPPDGCVDAAVMAWQRTQGDIRAVLRAIVASPDFWAAENRRARFKTPLEFVTSAVRALGAEPDTTTRLVNALQQLGEPPFMRLTPDGYPEVAADWLNSGAILTRMNLALGLASGRMPGVTVNLDSLVPATSDYDDLVRRVNAVILGGQGSERTLQVIRQQINDLPNTGNARAMAVALALGSPDFQKQ